MSEFVAGVMETFSQVALKRPEFGGVLRKAAEKLYVPEVSQDCQKNLADFDKVLESGSGVIYLNHGKRKDYGHYMAAVWLINQLKHKGLTAMVINARFGTKEGMNAAGQMVEKMLLDWKIESVMVKTDGTDPASIKNALTRCREILTRKGGLVLFYPEGEEGARSDFLTEGEMGAMLFGEYADWSMAGATFGSRKGKVVLKLGGPSENKVVIKDLIKQNGRRKARGIYREMIMGKIAGLLPTELRGVWAGKILT